jgi:uncharacterized protein YecT (DUF1311 family)
MLTVLYANGEGVKRDIPLALRFACEGGWAPAEVEGRAASLEALESAATTRKKRFDFCDDISSGFMMGFCAARQAELNEVERTISLSALSTGWPSGQVSAFATLIQAEQAYAEAHGRGEVNLSGTARGMEETGAEQTLRDNFLAAMQAFESGRLPDSSASQFSKADASLNELYRKLVAGSEAHKDEYGAVQPGGIRAAERAWLKYRDAWVGFAKLRYPSVSFDAWKALLTTDRIAVLNGTWCEVDPAGDDCKSEPDDGSRPRPLP